MKKLLIRLAFLPFALAIFFAAKTYWSKLWPVQSQQIVSNINEPALITNSERTIQLALLLDVSGSMDGLLEQAKAKLWNIVNQLGDARYGDEYPNLHISLYIYGGDDLSYDRGYVKQLTPFTSDLDLISENLFALTTNGGEEYCGQVIKLTLDELEWSNSDEDLKLVFIAGNEPFNQGPVSYRKICQQALERDIYVNTIFCGDYMEGVNTEWQSGAQLAGGQYLNIDHNEAISFIESPYDQEISDLNDEMNQTYIYYGSEGEGYYTRQAKEDDNASKYGLANRATRGISKSKGNYRNSNWDLVDAKKEATFKWAEVKKETLPEEYQSLSTEELKVKVEEKSLAREKIKSSIKDLEKKRKTYVSEKRKENAEQNTNSLDDALIKVIKDQATAKNYKFE